MVSKSPRVTISTASRNILPTASPVIYGICNMVQEGHLTSHGSMSFGICV